MIERKTALETLETTLRENPICALLGPRQCGKSTLARELHDAYRAKGQSTHWFDLESAEDLTALGTPALMPCAKFVAVTSASRQVREAIQVVAVR